MTFPCHAGPVSAKCIWVEVEQCGWQLGWWFSSVFMFVVIKESVLHNSANKTPNQCLVECFSVQLNIKTRAWFFLIFFIYIYIVAIYFYHFKDFGCFKVPSAPVIFFFFSSLQSSESPLGRPSITAWIKCKIETGAMVSRSSHEPLT